MREKDPLTQAFKRESFPAALSAAVDQARREGGSLGLIICDLDHFKSINDGFGHVRGDEVLAEYARRTMVTIRDHDELYRYGGDEFVLLLPRTTREQAARAAGRLLDNVTATPMEGDPPVSLSLSMGVAAFPEDTEDGDALFEIADRRLYEAKRRGRWRAVADDARVAEVSPFAQQTRLVERDDGIEEVRAFFTRTTTEGHGAVWIEGVPGAGRSRMLTEVRNAAHLAGFEILALQGEAALKGRSFGALRRGRGLLADSAPATVDGVVGTLVARLESSGRDKLLIAVDDWGEVDEATRELITRVVTAGRLPVIGLAAVVTEGELPEASLPSSMGRDRITVRALSPEGVRTWLRHILKWEVPGPFLDWLLAETGGLPASIESTLRQLIERGMLVERGGAWTLAEDIGTLPVGEALGRRTRLPPHNLPAAAAGIVGRDEELGEVKRLLAESRLVTVLGPGGMGKTRLSQQLAMEELRRFEDGAFFVALAGVDTPEFLVPTIAHALRFEFAGGADPKVQLLDFLREKRMLLVLDNFDHLVAGAPLVAEMLAGAPGIRILASSRERLNLREEAVLELWGLPVPPADDPAPERYASIQLFIERARTSQPGFEPDADDLQAISRICRIVDGVPLGVELAAVLVRLLPPAEIAAEIEKSFDLLATPLQDVPERHRSLRAVFEYSWNLLSEPERVAVARLSVFRGGFQRDAAARVAEVPLPLLAALIDKTLVRRAGEARYEMHGMLQQFAREKLEDRDDDARRMAERHASYYAGLLRSRAPLLRAREQRRAAEEVTREIENIRAAWQTVVEEGSGPADEMMRDLFRLYESRLWNREGRDSMRWAAEQLGEGSPYWAPLLTRQAYFTLRLFRLERAAELLDVALRRLREGGSREELAFALQIRGDLALQQGDYERARKMLSRAAKIFREISSHFGLASALNGLGLATWSGGDYERAEKMLRRSLSIRRRIGDWTGVVTVLNNLAIVVDVQGRRSEAKTIFEEALGLAREIGDRRQVPTSLTNVGVCTLHLARDSGSEPLYEQAHDLLVQAVDLFRETGDRGSLCLCLCNLGDLEHARDRDDAAFGLYREAVTHAAEMRADRLSARVLLGMGPLLAASGRTDEAAEAIVAILRHPATDQNAREQAATLLRELGHDDAPPPTAEEAEQPDLRQVMRKLGAKLRPAAGIPAT